MTCFKRPLGQRKSKCFFVYDKTKSIFFEFQQKGSFEKYNFGPPIFAHFQYIVVPFLAIPVINRISLTVCLTAGPALRVLADRHVILHIRHHRDADFRQH